MRQCFTEMMLYCKRKRKARIAEELLIARRQRRYKFIAFEELFMNFKEGGKLADFKDKVQISYNRILKRKVFIALQ